MWWLRRGGTMIDLHGTHQIQQVPFRSQKLKVTFGDAEGSMQALSPASGLALIYSTFPLPVHHQS
jgi:hypothetical protein